VEHRRSNPVRHTLYAVPATHIRGPVMLRPMDQPEETPTLPARYYRQKAAEARRAAEEVTTRAVKARLLGLAHEFDRLADAADSAAQTPDAPAGVMRRRR
jgi:hypothetical protein